MKKFTLLLLSLVLGLTALFAVGCKPADNRSVTLTYYSDASNLLPLMKQGTVSIGLLPEPACTKLTTMASDKNWTRIDIQEAYDEDTKSYPQAVLMVKSSVLKTYPDIVNYLSSTFSDNVTWVKENTAEAVTAVNANLNDGVTPSLQASAITSQVVDNCKIYWQSANDSKDAVSNYLNDIIDINENAAKAVTDEYFYNGESTGENTSATLTFVAPDGAPALSIAKYIADDDDLGTSKDIEYTVVASSDIGGIMQRGEADIMIMPVNASSKLYKANASDKYKMVSVVTHGNLYIMSNSDITLEDLKGKTIGVIGQGAVPDLTLQAVLKKNGINYQTA